VESPKLWLVGCRKGKEREAAINLMNKYIALKGTRDQLEIFSVFASDHTKESIYVEAYKKVYVTKAIKGMHLLFENRIDVIPIPEMADVFNMDTVQKLPFKPGSFVRVKTGDYKGDLAQVVTIEDQRTKAVVKLVPRLNKTGNKKIRAQQRMFNPSDHPTAERKHDKNTAEMYYFYNGMQFKDGFHYKKMSIKSL
jgi:transcription elongation factor SPT5